MYQQALVRLARSAVGAGRLESPDASATLDNPLCGDRVTVEVRLRDGRLEGLAHRVRGCVLCEAAASLLGRAAPGATPADVATARASAATLLRSGEVLLQGPWAELELFRPVRDVPSRHRCVLLPFDALVDALAKIGG